MTVSGMPLHGINDREHIGMGAILLLDRGPQNSGHACKFTLKAWHAQLVNAKAVSGMCMSAVSPVLSLLSPLTQRLLSGGDCKL